METQLDAIWEDVRQLLSAEKQRVSEEIWAYPAPIPACDAQYNALLEARSAILHEIGRVNSLFKHNPTMDEQLALLNALVIESPFIRGETATALQQQIHALQRVAVVT